MPEVWTLDSGNLVVDQHDEDQEQENGDGDDPDGGTHAQFCPQIWGLKSGIWNDWM